MSIDELKGTSIIIKDAHGMKKEEDLINKINETLGTSVAKREFKLRQEELQIYMTYDYGMFKGIKGNRIINPTNYAKLLTSMKEEYLYEPILVNEKFEIIDGQHRFNVCKALEYPVLYHIKYGYGMAQVKRANLSGVNWGKTEFLHTYTEEGNQNYLDFDELVNTYGITINDLLKVFAIIQKTNLAVIADMFEHGELSLEGKNEAVNFLDALEDFNFLSMYKSQYFTGAFMKLYFHPNYSHEQMVKKLETRGGYLKPLKSIDEYLLILTRDIYSVGTQRNPLFYDSSRRKFYSK